MSKYLIKKEHFKKFSGLFFLMFIPWTNFFNFFQRDIEKITSDLRFYQINTCEISLFQFLMNNFNVVYQDHYRIVFNSYSSIRCFGTITGIDQINDVFYISIGTNTLVNIFIMSIFIFISLSFLKNNSEKFRNNIYLVIIASLLGSALATFGIFAQQKFYARSLYFYDVTIKSEYFTFFLVFISTCLLFNYLIETRGYHFINYSPFVYIFVGVVNGMNLSLILLIFMNAGIIYFLKNFYKLRNISFYYFVLVCVWIANTKYTLNDNLFRLNPDKTIGIVSTEMNIFSTIYFSISAFFIILGINYLIKKSYNYFDFKIFEKNLINVSIFIFLIGYLSSNLPLMNFLTFYFSGQQKGSTTERNLFNYNEWGEFIAWRGFTPSAEMAGEIYAITLLVFFSRRLISKNYKFKVFQLLKLLVPMFGLYLSNNRAAISSLVVILIYIFIYENLHKNKKFLFNRLFIVSLIFFTVILFYLISDDYAREKVLFESLNASYSNQKSTSLNFLLSDGFIRNYFLSIISVFSVFINRSVLWGLFISRYNPVPLEFLFGSSPFNLAQLYGEVNIKPTSSFLLPHSSFLDMLVFFGLFNLFILLVFLFYILLKSVEKNHFIYYSLIFISVNLIKSDSILYISSFIFYVTILIVNFENTLKVKSE